MHVCVCIMDFTIQYIHSCISFVGENLQLNIVKNIQIMHQIKMCQIFILFRNDIKATETSKEWKSKKKNMLVPSYMHCRSLAFLSASK